MSQDLVSVIVPAYNAESTIREALESVYRQSYKNLEVIVVDDGSTDTTRDIVGNGFPQALLKSSENQGPSHARNMGIEASHGKWIAFLDADDVWHPDKIAHQVDVAQTDPSIGLVASDWIRHPEFADVPKALPVSHVAYHDLLILNRFQTSTVLVLSSVVHSLNGFDYHVDGAEDWDLWLRVAQRVRVVKVDWPLVAYRDVPTGYSKDLWRVYVTMLPMLEKHRRDKPVKVSDFHTIESWHHLRFFVAFLLLRQYSHAFQALKPAFSIRLLPRLIPALYRYLIPFLWVRVKKKAQ
ncbi:MAG: glycosyltransferase family 2 protein [Sulfobacillus benefaciens]|jgi:glycosyltransferase involved in cell wall biosynthesis|uniref:Glycosyltransferase family 2 protein n=1 Tax=Sulfobacillus benefaciens TaxID=453960 RepID=A0A2T2WGA8_9FIRM|nr:MAG: glycosyltransferase family 2 protein [Sulfobacillus benefaciens]HBQ96754.1 glycosyltransferase family 2 protein [Sulfobacillus sp.]